MKHFTNTHSNNFEIKSTWMDVKLSQNEEQRKAHITSIKLLCHQYGDGLKHVTMEYNSFFDHKNLNFDQHVEDSVYFCRVESKNPELFKIFRDNRVDKEPILYFTLLLDNPLYPNEIEAMNDDCFYYPY